MRRNKNPIVKKSHKKKKIILGAIVTVVVLVGGLAVTELTDTTYFLHDRKAVSSTIAAPTTTDKPKSSGSDKSTTPSPSPATPNPQPTGGAAGSPKEGDATTNTNAPLIEPYGDFVSNHTPGKNGAPTVVTSVCVTTPGAKCTITFTNAANPSIVKTLAAGTADGSGTVYWNNWDVKAAGFTSGIWHIKATATLNRQTKSTADGAAFEVHL